MKKPLLFSATLILCTTLVAQVPQGISHQTETNNGQTNSIMHQPDIEGFNQQPLEQLLNPDGTLNLNSGFSGSVDPRGFRMLTGPDGEPRFVREAKEDIDYPFFSKDQTRDGGDENWHRILDAYDGMRYEIRALAVSGEDVYVGGHVKYEVGDGMSADYIARWDGTSWSALGSWMNQGVNDWVRAIAISGSDIYVGGNFTQAGGQSANYIARWDTTTETWSNLGSGVNEPVLSIAVSGSDVYVGGSFTQAGGISANYIAKWDSTTETWSALGSGVDSFVYAIAVSGSDIFVGGIFTQAGGMIANRIAIWNGYSWVPLGSGVNHSVYAIAVSGSDVYVGGNFTEAGGQSANYVAKWDVNTGIWSALGSGVNEPVRAIDVSGSNVYVGGWFTQAGGISSNRIAKWDTNTEAWSPLGSGVNADVHAITASDSDVYVGGWFSQAGDVSVNRVRIARWNGTSWERLENGVNNSVGAIAVSGSEIYVGGTFTEAGNAFASRIAKWNGISWSTLGFGVSEGSLPHVRAIALSGNDVYVGGHFLTAGGTSAMNIAKWDGTTWSALGSGIGGEVHAIAVSGSDVYVGGGFIQAGGNPANRIAKWDGTSWSALSSGVNGTILSIAVSGSDVYVGGEFTQAGGNPANRIAKWNGTAWSALGGGIGGAGGAVNAIVASGNDVYVGGWFTQAGGQSISHIAKWNSSAETWSALGSGVNETVRAISVIGSDVYVGGSFQEADGISANRIARWNGSSWSALGSGVNISSLGCPVNGAVLAIAASESGLYVGGAFTKAGGKPSSYIARWSEPQITQHNVTFLEGEGGSISGDKVQIVEHGGSTTEVEAVAAPGFAFTEWTGDYTSTDNPLTIHDVESDMTVTANFEVVEIPDAIYVSFAGSADNSGLTPDDPVVSISHGIDIAQLMGAPRVKVAEGTYLVYSPIEMVEGVSLYGGYNPDFSNRRPSEFETIINDGQDGSEQWTRTINFDSGITNATVFDGFTVNGGTGSNTHLMVMRIAGAPIIRNNKIRGWQSGSDNRTLSIVSDGGSVIMNNEIVSRSSQWADQAIYINRHSLIANNIIRSMGGNSSRLVTFRGGSDAKLFNNLIICGSATINYATHIEGGNNVDIRNNIVFAENGTTTYGLFVHGSDLGPAVFQNNNLFSLSYLARMHRGGTTYLITSITDLNDSEILDPTITGNNIETEMVTAGFFVDPATGNWRLSEICPESIRSGGQDLTSVFNALEIPVEDKAGISRPVGSWSMGPYEFKNNFPHILSALVFNAYTNANITLRTFVDEGLFPISNVNLFYTLNGSEEQTIAAVYEGESIWVASFGQHLGGTEISWRLLAVDEQDNEAQWPPDGGWMSFKVIEPGLIAAWGLNDHGQCDVPELNEDFVAVVGGAYHSLGLRSDGTITAWGWNQYGQCDVPEPNEDYVAVAGVLYHSLGLRSDGTITAWGWNQHGQCDVPAPNEGFVAVSGGAYHSLGLKSDGTVVVWGENSFGQCDIPSPNSDFVAVAGGYHHNLGLKSDGSIVAWGYNEYGQCDVPEPNSDFVAVAGGSWHSLGLKSDGTVVVWGYNSFGQSSVPEPNSDFVAVAGGSEHSLALRSDGAIVVWGLNSYGQCDVPSPNEGFIAVAGGGIHSLALKRPPQIYTLTLNLDMSLAPGFNPETDLVYVTGTFVDFWPIPGTDPDNQLMTRVGETMIWTKTFHLEEGDYEYKYFLNDEWDGGEWSESTNRTVYVDDDLVVNDIWGHFVLELDANPEVAGTVIGGGVHPFAAVVPIVANHLPGGEFINWSGDIEFVEDANSPNTTVTIPAHNIILTANFAYQDPEFICGTSTVTFNYNGSQVTYGTVISAGRCWLDRNLGASRVAISSDDNLAYGDLFQWGRGDDGHQLRSSGIVSSLSSNDTPGHDNFITVSSSPNDWRSPQNHNLWQGVDGINSPCPSGFRLPTEDELEDERQSWSDNNAAGAFSSPLKLPLAGFRDNGDGSLKHIGTGADYWSGSVDGTSSWGLFFWDSFAGVGDYFRAIGRSVRCVKDEPPTSFNLYLEVNPLGGGTVIGAGQHEIGTLVSISAEANSGYEFVTWTGDTEHVDDANSAHTTVTMPASDILLTAGFVKTGIPENLLLTNETIPDGYTGCFDALQTITVSDFTVQAGGSVTFIAGQSIHLLPGTTVMHGGYLHARIAAYENDFCGMPKAAEIAEEPCNLKEVVLSVNLPDKVNDSDFFKVYPNPTTGEITLELYEFELLSTGIAEIYSMQGQLITRKELPAQKEHILSLAQQQPGIYLLRISYNNKIGSVRIIKQ